MRGVGVNLRRMPQVAAPPLPVVDGRPIARLLIVKLSSLGDVVHALPVAAALRSRFPALHLTWAVEARCAPLVHQQGVVDAVIELPRLEWGAFGGAWLAAMRAPLAAIRAARCDAVLDLQGLLKSALLALAAGAPVRLGVAPQREGAQLVVRAVPSREGRAHVVEQYLAAARYLGAEAEPVRFGLRVDAVADAAIGRRLASAGIDAGRPLLVVNPSPSRRAKRWPLRHWVEAIRALSADGTVVLVGGPEHRAAHARLGDAGGVALDLTGATNLLELTALLARAAVHLAPDTGSLHLAAALGRPAIGIYGPTPTWRLGPWGQPDNALSGAAACGVGCPRLCWRRRCLDAVTPAAVIERTRQVLAAV